MHNSNNLLERIPKPNQRHIALHISASAEREIRRGHPWLFEHSIRRISHEGNPGDLAVVFDQQRRFLAVGLYDPASPIRARLLQHRQQAAINPSWFQKKIESAFEARHLLPNNTNGYRLINGGNDGLPGFVLDKYAQNWVLKLYSAAWIPHLHALLPILISLTPERIILRLGRQLEQQPQHLYGLKDGDLLWGASLQGNILFQEYGLTFEVDPLRGHKTGFYLDQRENRARVRKLSSQKSVLNVFAYTGGFSVYAACGRAKNITSIDISQPALDMAARNFKHNQISNTRHDEIVGDAFNTLAELQEKNQHYDMVILDPPSFASNQTQIAAALNAYRRLTRLALGVLKSGGVLVQASCSSRIPAEDFFTAVHQAANKAGRPLHEIERTGHPGDHPIGFAEGAYLKCLFASA
jgi:23S rRNA (cytosine1962-C5)-methyltransferase